MPINAIIFDLDGTLLDSVTDIGTALNAALAEAGLPTHPLERYKTFVGEGVEHLVTLAMAPVPLDINVLNRYRELYLTQMFKLSQPYPGIEAALLTLHGRGIKLAVLSNKQHLATAQLVPHYFSGVPFEVVYGNRADWPRKPDPTAALAIADELGVSPAECAFVGDSAIDCLTAKNAGMPLVAVTWGFKPREELLQTGATTLVDDAQAMLAALLRLAQ